MSIKTLDRLKSQLLVSGLQQRDNPTYQVINQLIDYLRKGLQDLETMVNEATASGGTSISITNNNSMPLAMELETHEEHHYYINNPNVNPTPKVLPNSIPYWVEGDCDAAMPPPMYTLRNPNEIPETAIIDGTILARVAANEQITGQWMFNNPIVSIENVTPQFIMRDSSGPLDEKYWRLIPAGGDLYIQGLNDAFSLAYSAAIFRRNGIAGGYLEIPTGVALSRQVAVTLTADQTAWAPTSIGEVYYYEVTATSPWIIRGITAQAAGTEIIFVNVGANTIQFNHEDGAASAANRIRNPGSVNIAIVQYGSFRIVYDGIASRWQVVSWE